jgi:hypothetical protein
MPSNSSCPTTLLAFLELRRFFAGWPTSTSPRMSSGAPRLVRS